MNYTTTQGYEWGNIDSRKLPILRGSSMRRKRLARESSNFGMRATVVWAGQVAITMIKTEEGLEIQKAVP